MNRLRQYCSDRIRATVASTAFETTDDMLAIPWVDSWRTRPDFHRFSLDGRLIVAELEGGNQWRVVGFVRNPARIDLPKFTRPAQSTAVRRRQKNAAVDS
jgi:hypothetical protein